jgi:hypothetical protein
MHRRRWSHRRRKSMPRGDGTAPSPRARHARAPGRGSFFRSRRFLPRDDARGVNPRRCGERLRRRGAALSRALRDRSGENIRTSSRIRSTVRRSGRGEAAPGLRLRISNRRRRDTGLRNRHRRGMPARRHSCGRCTLRPGRCRDDPRDRGTHCTPHAFRGASSRREWSGSESRSGSGSRSRSGSSSQLWARAPSDPSNSS